MLGVFDGCEAFAFNTKCIVFSLVMAMLYWWFKPSLSTNILLIMMLIFAFGWYGLYYSCTKLSIPHMAIWISIFFVFLAYAPRRNIFVLLFTLYFSYLFMSWFDYKLDCQLGKLVPTSFPLGKYIYLPFKDPEYKAKYASLCDKRINQMNKIDRITIAVLIGVVFIVVIGYLTKSKVR